MADDTIETGVDALLSLLKEKDKVSLEHASKVLKTPNKVVQAWVDFLVEEKILGIEYKFTKPYIFLNKKTEKKDDKEVEIKKELTDFQKEFYEHAEEKQLPKEKIRELWIQHLKSATKIKEEYFMREAQKRGLEGEVLWKKYQEYILSV